MSLAKEKLNKIQDEIVRSSKYENSLILAGAGSGKTRVLTHRIAWLINEGARPSDILAVTFSNKAAQELKCRINELVGVEAGQGISIGTFHNISHRLLRIYGAELRCGRNFQIIDADDQSRIAKRIIKSTGLDLELYQPKYLLKIVEEKKRRKQHLSNTDLARGANKKIEESVACYIKELKSSNLLDFSDLIIEATTLFKSPCYKEGRSGKYKHILVDEFQDTDELQYDWLASLKCEENTIMAVGDDDQAIYEWRGASPKNLRRFCKEITPCKIYKLEENYRSTEKILSAANHLISNNTGRFEKNLWTSGSSGENILVYRARSDLGEGRFVASTIKHIAARDGLGLQEFAVLYRNNAQSRIIEESLISAGITYKVQGGLRFFDRQEIKDAMAYLKVVSNPHDNASLERVIQTPPKGIGEKSLTLIRERAASEETSIWISCQTLVKEGGTRSNSISNLIEAVERWTKECSALDLSEKLEYLIRESGIWRHYERMVEKEKTGAEGRLENLSELIYAAKNFCARYKSDSGIEVTDEFIAQAALDQTYLKETNSQAGAAGAVNLMTLHASKGLEFRYVFIIGFEDGIFPAQSANMIPEKLTEERRLAYVGITRAREKLIISYAAQRAWYGKIREFSVSRFLEELPEQNLKLESDTSWCVRQENKFTPKYNQSSASHGARGGASSVANMAGKRVEHPTYGQGSIVNVEGEGDKRRVEVEFRSGEKKVFLERLAKLTIL